MERYIAKARHIEVQIFGDGDKVVHLFERECSLQRKRQKVWEEGPSIALSAKTRAAILDSAVRLANRVKYRGAGTLEYLYDDQMDEFFFIEMNTRIQVEHPVTEAITGFDLVEAQLRVAGGEKLWINQGDLICTGHAIEVRINAENPARKFMPSPGTVTAYSPPSDARFDTLLYEGCKIVPFYDSLIGKLIVHAETRVDALRRLETSLRELTIKGINTTVPLHIELVSAHDVVTGNVNTTWLESWMDRWQPTSSN
jgi:acetyl-CoA carboxylase biotin carboxylase subunit